MKKVITLIVLIGGILLGSWRNSDFSVVPDDAAACDYCLLTRGFAPPETPPGLGLRADARYTVLNSVFAGTNQVANHDGEKETHFTTQLTLRYGFSEKFTLVGILPIPRRSVSLRSHEAHANEEPAEEADHGQLHQHAASGSALNFGDLTILGRYTFLKLSTFKQATTLALEGGIKVPTGQTDARDAEGHSLDAHIQPGTGSWNYLVGLSVNHINNTFGLSSNLLYSFNTTGEAGEDDYRYGNWLNADLTAKVELLSSQRSGRSFFLTFGLNGEFRGKEKINGQEIENTGGEVLYLSPGVQIKISRSIKVEASFQYPFYHNLNGEQQLGEDFKTFFGFNYLL
ncbi:MAG: transporter [bacterium]